MQHASRCISQRQHPLEEEGYVKLLWYRKIKIPGGNQYKKRMMPFEINICGSRERLSENYVTFLLIKHEM